MKKFALLTVLVCGVSLVSEGQPAPTARYSFALAFDESRGKLVMFGGSNKGVFMNDTWEWNGAQWELKSLDGPAPRNSPVMAYDIKRKTMVLFGGDAGNWSNKSFFNDTWEWNGTRWKLLSGEGPPARTNHTLAYDQHRDRVVLFGGMVNGKTLGDLWEWDGSTWMQASASGGPEARFLHASAFDESNGSVMIFGGNTVVGPPSKETIKGDLWSWDGRKWELFKGNGPSPRDHVDMVYERESKKLIVHGGGLPDGTSAQDTWVWNGKAWSVTVTQSGAPMEGYKLAYNSRDGVVLLFGGFVGGSPSSSIWKLINHDWKIVK